MKIIIPITVHPKAGEAIKTRWGITQNIPYPSIGNGPYFKWQNTDGLFPSFSKPAKGIGRSYSAVLLRSDEENPDTSTREGHAEFNGAPGTFSLRGVNMGEVAVRITLGDDPSETPQSTWKVIDYDDPTAEQLSFLKTNILPVIHFAIQDNLKVLEKWALDQIEVHTARHLKDARESLDKLEAKMADAIKELRERVEK